MKIATYFIKLGAAGLVTLAGFVMFICGLSDLGLGGYFAFFGLAVFGLGAYLVGQALTTECPVKFNFTAANNTNQNLFATSEMPAVNPADFEAPTQEPVASSTTSEDNNIF